METAPILIIEDNPDDVEVMFRVFRKCGVTADVRVAQDGADALVQLEGGSPNGAAANGIVPAVVFRDLDLPRIGGFEVLRSIRNTPRIRHVPVFLLAGTETEEDLIADRDLRASDYIQKPLDTETFRKTMTRLRLLNATSDRNAG